jgi:hypothetical protein
MWFLGLSRNRPPPDLHLDTKRGDSARVSCVDWETVVYHNAAIKSGVGCPERNRSRSFAEFRSE